LNRAIREARGEYLVRVDGHTVIAPDYVRRCVALLQETGASNVGGAMTAVGDTPMGQAIAAAGKSPFAVPTAFHISATAQFTDTVYMGAWHRSVFERIGGFDEHFMINEDYEHNYRIRRAGGRIYFSPLVCSSYYGRQTLHALARQYFRYGQWKVQTLSKHPRSARPRHVVAPAFVSVVLVGGVGALQWRAVRTLWFAVLAVYGATNALFAFRSAHRAQTAAAWRVALVFLVIHLSWGSGFLAGLVRGLLADRERETTA
jgi:GT2 family glycosyltransferase